MDKVYKAVLFLGLAAVMIFAPIARGAVRPWSVTPVLLVVYGVIFLWMFKMVNAKRGQSLLTESNSHGTVPFLQSLSLAALNVPILLFAILALNSFAFSIYKHDSFYALVRLFAYIGLYYLVLNEFGHRMRRQLIWLVISIGVGLSAYGLLQYFGLLDHSWWAPKGFLSATYVNHNHFAGWLELVIPVAVALAVKKSAAHRLILVAALTLMAAAFILTQSRGGWISLGVSLLVMSVMMAMKGPGRLRMAVIAALIAIAAISLLCFTKDVVSLRMSTITDARPGEDPSSGRFKIWQGAIGMIREKPLTGFGIGDFDAGFYRYRPEGFNSRAVYAHNDYLHMASEMGLAAPALMIWIFILAIREGFRKQDKSLYAFGCAAGVLSLALHGMVDFNFHIPANMILFTVWITVIVGESNRNDRS